MERYTMFLNWKTQRCENEYTTQSNLQIQCNPYQTTNGIFHRTRTKNFTVCIETQKTPNSQSNLEKENWAGGTRFPDFRLYYKVIVIKTVWYRHKTKYKSMEQDRKPRDKHMHIWSPNVWQRRKEYIIKERQSLQ